MSGRDRRTGPTSIEDVLQLIDAQPIPDVDELAHMSMAEIERQLADLGVDTDAQITELLERIESPSMAPLASMSEQDLDRLSVARVERQLEAEGVDVRAWLSRAETLIRNARGREQLEQPQDTSTARLPGRLPDSSRSRTSGALSHRQRVGAHSAASSGGRWKKRRRLPRALAASIVMVVVAGVTFSILDQPEFDSDTLLIVGEASAPAQVTVAPVLERAESRKHKDLQLSRVPPARRSVGQDLPQQSQLSTENRVHSRQIAPLAAQEAMQASVDEARQVSPLVRPEAPPLPSVADAVRSSESESSVVARLAEPRPKKHAAEPSLPSRGNDRLIPSPALVAGATGAEEKRSNSTKPRGDQLSRDSLEKNLARLASEKQIEGGSIASATDFRAKEAATESLVTQQPAPRRARVAGIADAEQAAPNVAPLRSGAAPGKLMNMAEAAAPMRALRQERVAPLTAIDAHGASTTVYSMAAGQTLAASLTRMRLTQTEREALTRIFDEVDLSRGAILRLTVVDEQVQSATLDLPQGRSLSVSRNARGDLVLER